MVASIIASVEQVPSSPSLSSSLDAYNKVVDTIFDLDLCGILKEIDSLQDRILKDFHQFEIRHQEIAFNRASKGGLLGAFFKTSKVKLPPDIKKELQDGSLVEACKVRLATPSDVKNFCQTFNESLTKFDHNDSLLFPILEECKEDVITLLVRVNDHVKSRKDAAEYKSRLLVSILSSHEELLVDPSDEKNILTFHGAQQEHLKKSLVATLLKSLVIENRNTTIQEAILFLEDKIEINSSKEAIALIEACINHIQGEFKQNNNARVKETVDFLQNQKEKLENSSNVDSNKIVARLISDLQEKSEANIKKENKNSIKKVVNDLYVSWCKEISVKFSACSANRDSNDKVFHRIRGKSIIESELRDLQFDVLNADILDNANFQKDFSLEDRVLYYTKKFFLQVFIKYIPIIENIEYVNSVVNLNSVLNCLDYYRFSLSRTKQLQSEIMGALAIDEPLDINSIEAPLFDVSPNSLKFQRHFEREFNNIKQQLQEVDVVCKRFFSNEGVIDKTSFNPDILEVINKVKAQILQVGKKLSLKEMAPKGDQQKENRQNLSNGNTSTLPVSFASSRAEKEEALTKSISGLALSPFQKRGGQLNPPTVISDICPPSPSRTR